jgi:hypothetical protein
MWGGPWRVRDFGDDFGVALTEAEGDANIRRSSAFHLEMLLRRAEGGRGPVHDMLVDIHRELFGSVALGHRAVPVASLRLDLAAAAQSGRIAVTRTERRAVVLPLDEAPSSEPLGPASSSATVDWLEIKVVDSDGKPVPGVLYSVTTADGTNVQGRVDQKGFARLDGLTSGNCTVTFPEVDRAEMQAV